MNHNIVGEEQRARASLQQAGLDGGSLAIVTAVCCRHSAALCTRPIYEKVDGLAGNLVRLAHLLESGRAAAQFNAHLIALVDSTFDYKRVVRYPPEVEVWRAQNARVLSESHGARDLTPEARQRIIDFDNGCWDEAEKITHDCLPRCQFGCFDKASSLQTA